MLVNEVVFTNEKIRMALYEVELPTGPTNEPAAVSTGMQDWYRGTTLFRTTQSVWRDEFAVNLTNGIRGKQELRMAPPL